MKKNGDKSKPQNLADDQTRRVHQKKTKLLLIIGAIARFLLKLEKRGLIEIVMPRQQEEEYEISKLNRN